MCAVRGALVSAAPPLPFPRGAPPLRVACERRSGSLPALRAAACSKMEAPGKVSVSPGRQAFGLSRHLERGALEQKKMGIQKNYS